MSILASGEFWAFVGVMAGIYTLLTLGLQVQFGLAGLLNFGQVGFMAIGAYTMAILVVKAGWSMWIAAPLAILAATLAGVLVGLPTLRLRGDYFAIVTIAFSEIVRYVATNEDSLTGGSQGTINLSGAGAAAQYDGAWQRFQQWLGGLFHIGSKDVVMLVVIWTVAVVLLAATAEAARTPWGRVLRAIREDEEAAASLGKHVFGYRLQALALGAALAGAGRLLLRLAVLVLQSRRLPATHDLLRLDDPHSRWRRACVGGPCRGGGVRLPLRRHALLRLPAVLVSRLGRPRLRAADRSSGS